MCEVFNLLTMYDDHRYSAVASKPDERAIIFLLRLFPRPLRPKEISRHIPQFSSSKSPNRLFYHLQKLEAMNLVSRQSIDRACSFYDITEKGKEFFNEIFNKDTLHEFITYMIISAKHGYGWRDLNETEAYMRFYDAIESLFD